MKFLHRLLLIFALDRLIRRRPKPKPWGDAFSRAVALHMDKTTPGGMFGTGDFETPWGDEPRRMRGLHERNWRAW